MLIRRCDRCGKEPESGMESFVKIEFYKTGSRSGLRYYDLCSNCTEELLTFMNNEMKSE